MLIVKLELSCLLNKMILNFSRNTFFCVYELFGIDKLLTSKKNMEIKQL